MQNKNKCLIYLNILKFRKYLEGINQLHFFTEF